MDCPERHFRWEFLLNREDCMCENLQWVTGEVLFRVKKLCIIMPNKAHIWNSLRKKSFYYFSMCLLILLSSFWEREMLVHLGDGWYLFISSRGLYSGRFPPLLSSSVAGFCCHLEVRGRFSAGAHQHSCPEIIGITSLESLKSKLRFLGFAVL